MAEVPEHLLQRSAARRAQLTGEGGGDTGAATPAVAGESAPAAAAPAAAPPKVTPTEPAFIEPVNKEAYERVQAIKRRRIPAWAMGVLAMVPLWGALYVGAFGERHSGHEEVVSGATVYANRCASCHGANGQGGTGPKLSGGESVKTFPDEADHVAWVVNGSASAKGDLYGAADREGGQRGPATGGMPAFGSQLSQEEIDMVVAYEREDL